MIFELLCSCIHMCNVKPYQMLVCLLFPTQREPIWIMEWLFLLSIRGDSCCCVHGDCAKVMLPCYILGLNTAFLQKYAHGFCFAVLCCGYTLTDFPISIRLTSLALWQSNDCPSASKATLMNMDKYFMWIHYERLHNHNKAKHNKTVCIFLGIYCTAYPIECHVAL